ncbi:MAG: hypothetical protein NW207_06755 [Cytophagales bacterium]|nr:hypothetical protein [Cytophagales bacterium]
MSEEYEDEAPQPMSNLTKILIGIVVLQTAIIIFLLVGYKQGKDQISDLDLIVKKEQEEVLSKTKELENIASELTRVKQEREKLGLDNQTLNSQIEEMNTAMTQLKGAKKLDANKRKELETMIAKMRDEITKKDQEINELKAQNETLTTDVSRLSTEKTQLSDSLSNVGNKKSDLESKLKYAAILKSENLKITVLKSNGKEVEDDVYKASRIDKVKITFTLADNKAAKQENKDFYLRITDPAGAPITDPNNSQVFTLSNGSTLQYTSMNTAKFDNTGQTIEFITQSGYKYTAGSYKVEVYCDGFKIGEKFMAVK